MDEVLRNELDIGHWTALKIVLGVNKEMFLDYGGDKEFGVKGYVDASFNTYPMNLRRKPDTESGTHIWNSFKWNVEAAFTI